MFISIISLILCNTVTIELCKYGNNDIILLHYVPFKFMKTKIYLSLLL